MADHWKHYSFKVCDILVSNKCIPFNITVYSTFQVESAFEIVLNNSS